MIRYEATTHVSASIGCGKWLGLDSVRHGRFSMDIQISMEIQT